MKTLYFKTFTDAPIEFSDPQKNRIRAISLRIDGKEEVILGEEREIIEKFVETVRKENPDRMVGFKQDYDDLPFMEKRAKTCGVSFDIGKGGNVKFSGKYFRGIILRETVIPGRENIDLFAIAWRDFPRLPTKEIDELADALGMEFRRIPQYRLNKMNDDELARYAGDYVEMIEKIANEILPFEESISRICEIPLDRQIRMTVGELVDHIVKGEMERRGISPMRIGGKGRYSGGYVWLKAPGVYDDVVYIDFQSMYPNIIKAWNISPETVDSEGKLVEVEGVRHHVRDDVKGVIPEIIENFLQRRLELKREIKERYDKVKDAEQRALKVIVNAMYGYMGWDGATYYNRNAAELIAALARYYIKEVRKIIEEKGGDVIYIDTDGAQFIGGDVEDIVNEINERFPLNIEVERVASRAVYWTKKKYAHLVDDKVVAVGVEYIRKDYPGIVKRAQREIVELLLRGKHEEARKTRRAYRERIARREASIEELAIVEQLTKKIEEYEKPTKASVAARVIRDKFGIEVHRGTNIYVVIVRGDGGPTMRAMPMELVSPKEVDWDYYLKIYDDTMKRTFEPFGVSLQRKWF